MKKIKTVIGENGFGVRVLCNLSPKELEQRKEEVIQDFLNKIKIQVEFELKQAGCVPKQSSDLAGYWSYFINLRFTN